jgi:hypothetical protein
VAINALIGAHWMRSYPTHPRSRSHRTVALAGNRRAAFQIVPARNRGNLADAYFRSHVVIIQYNERNFLPGLKARVSVPNI